MRLNTNEFAMNSVRNLMYTGLRQASALEKLSSGKKINRASDNAAGYAISEKMAMQIAGLKTASKNSLDGISMVQTAEGALNEVTDILQRMRELAVQSSNDSNTYEDRLAIQKEINQLTSEINRISTDTEFNKLKLFVPHNEDGTLKSTMSIPIQCGANAKQMIEANFGEIRGFALGITSSYSGERALGYPQNIKLNGNLDKNAGKGIPEDPLIGFYPENIDEVYEKIPVDETSPQKGVKYKIKKQYQDNEEKKIKGILGKTISTVILDKNGEERKIHFDFVKTPRENEWDVYGFYVNNDGAMIPMDGRNAHSDKNFILGSGKTTTLRFDANGNLQFPTRHSFDIHLHENGKRETISDIKLDFSNITQKEKSDTVNSHNNVFYYNDTPLENTAIVNRDYITNKAKKDVNENLIYKKEYPLDVTSHESATSAIKMYDKAISKISDIRSSLGAIQNRLEHTVKNLDSTSENVTSAMSRIQDADMAEEMTEFTKFNILQQAGTSMLAQANQLPQMILKLLES